MTADGKLVAAFLLILMTAGGASEAQSLAADQVAPPTQTYQPPLIGRRVPVYTPSIAIPQGPNRLSMKDVEQAVLQGANARDQWVVTGKRPGEVNLTVIVRSHQARVKVLYNTNMVRIDLVDSTNLLQSGGKIHRNYNKWAILLQGEIQSALLKKTGGQSR